MGARPKVQGSGIWLKSPALKVNEAQEERRCNNLGFEGLGVRGLGFRGLGVGGLGFRV